MSVRALVAFAAVGAAILCHGGCGSARQAGAGEHQPAAGDPGAPPSESAPRFRQDVSWSADGRWIAYSEYDGRTPFDAAGWSIFISAPDGSGRRRLVERAMFVAWSPDGKRLAFGSGRDGNPEIYTIGADGAGLSRLTDDPAKDQHPAWSPDGKQIAFSSNRAGSEGIFVIPAAGGEARRLTTDAARDFNPQWSPDGTRIVFFRERGDRTDQIHWVEVASGKEHQVTRDEFNNVFPSFLPDGRIGYVSGRPGDVEALIVVSPDGSGAMRIGERNVSLARWSPDGRTIALVAGNWPRSAIFVMKADGTGVRAIVE
jgi:TolB protein